MRRIKIAILLLITGLAFTMVGCSDSRYDVVKKALEDKYGEEMLVYSVEALGIKYEAKCAPANNPEVVFEARMLTDGTNEWDDYYQRYTAKLMNDILKEDLKQFFPDAYFKSIIPAIKMIDTSMDFREHSLEEILENSISEGSYGGIILNVFIDKEIGTTNDYEGEYQYLTETVNEYIKDGKMLPVSIRFFWLTSETQERVRQYYLTDLDNDDYFQTEILGTMSYKYGIATESSSDVGDPPNVSACFNELAEEYVKNQEEYVRRRELLENE